MARPEDKENRREYFRDRLPPKPRHCHGPECRLVILPLDHDSNRPRQS